MVKLFEVGETPATLDPVVRIFEGAAAGERSTLIMPTDTQLRQLSGIVYRLRPGLDPRRDNRSTITAVSRTVKSMATGQMVRVVQRERVPDAAPFDQAAHDRNFKYAFRTLGALGRLPDVEQRTPHAASWWIDYMNGWLAERGIAVDVGARMFVTCVLAAGDVPWSADGRYGLAREHAGLPARDAWRRVLEVGALRPASPSLDQRSEYQPGAVQVHQLAPGAVGLVGSTIR